MNIILEGGINFYDELNNIDTDTDDEYEKSCLLTNMPLDKNSIKLPCSHEFNFFPLYNEVFHQKVKSSTSHLNTDKLAFNQIKCPYCRQKFDFLLPHIRLNKDMLFCAGVNTPEGLSMDFHKCEYIFKNGKRANDYCSKTAYYGVAGCYCPTHQISMEKKASSKKQTNIVIDLSGHISNDKSTVNAVLSNKTNVFCSAVLKTGKRLGQDCGSKTCTESTQFCKRHLPN